MNAFDCFLVMVIAFRERERERAQTTGESSTQRCGSNTK